MLAPRISTVAGSFTLTVSESITTPGALDLGVERDVGARPHHALDVEAIAMAARRRQKSGANAKRSITSGNFS